MQPKTCGRQQVQGSWLAQGAGKRVAGRQPECTAWVAAAAQGVSPPGQVNDDHRA